jgi:hypothetical protein
MKNPRLAPSREARVPCAVAFASMLAVVGCSMQAKAPTPPGVAPSVQSARIIEPDAGTTTVPNFGTSFVFGGKTYALKMVGTDPKAGGVTTTVADQIIPVKLVFSDGTILDGKDEVDALTASPIFVNATFPSGTTQFADALMRAEFWKYVKPENYHVLLATPAIETTVRVDVPPGDGSIVNGEGRVTYQWFVQTIEPQILQQLNVDPTTLSVFLTKNTRVLEQSGHCCFNGYHSSFPLTGPSGPETFTTAWASVSAGSVTHMAHEVAEWMNDPFYTNVVPKWMSPVGNFCGGRKLEVGDPLAGSVYTVHGYLVEDMTFYSWFSHDVPSIGIHGRYDMRAMLTGPASVCP